MEKQSRIINGDCLDELKKLENDSIDLVCTDPPYGYSFMGKDWDKAVPSVDIWRECLRVLKPGAFCFVMSAPRSDVQNAMISRLMEAGFRLDFTPIYWTYASGFPKAGNIGKLVDKRLGIDRQKTGVTRTDGAGNAGKDLFIGGPDFVGTTSYEETMATSDAAKALDGSYAGFQPKPAVEVIIVAMKPLSEKTYVDQALKNGKGITWLDDVRIPTDAPIETGRNEKATFQASEVNNSSQEYQSQGRFSANLLVSDDVLGDHSKFFTLPFLVVPKASKAEKNKGLEDKNHHPTVKPLKLMSYLITLGSRPGDTVLDPFVGSGTTVLACENLGRIGLGIEREEEYASIANARLKDIQKNKQIRLVDDR